MTTAQIRHPGELRWETRLLSVVAAVLVSVGIAACYAAGTYRTDWFLEAQQQVSGAIVGGVLFLMATRLDYGIWQRLARPMFYVTVLGLVIIAMIALAWRKGPAPGLLEGFFPRINASRRWVSFWPGGPQVQVAEIARIVLPVLVASISVDVGRRIRDFRLGFVPVLKPILLVALLVAAQPNLSTAILLTVAGLVCAFIAGVRISHLMLLVPPALAGVAAMLFLNTERLDRLRAFMVPGLECKSGLDQVCDSLIGMGNGGLVGVGFGQGTQKLGHLAYGYSDFMLSVIGEEWGFIGVVFLALMFVLFCWMGFRIAATADDEFGTILAGGLTTMIGISAFMHAAVALKVMPATGLTLPFISAGRIALVVNLWAAGIIVSVGRRRGKPRRSRR